MRYEFAGFQFDPDRGLLRGGRGVHLPRKPFRLLAELLVERGGLLSKSQIAERVWGRADVTDDSIFRAVHQLRRSFAPYGVDPIGTVHGDGFRLASASWLRWRSRTARTPVRSRRSRTARIPPPSRA